MVLLRSSLSILYSEPCEGSPSHSNKNSLQWPTKLHMIWSSPTPASCSWPDLLVLSSSLYSCPILNRKTWVSRQKEPTKCLAKWMKWTFTKVHHEISEHQGQRINPSTVVTLLFCPLYLKHSTLPTNYFTINFLTFFKSLLKLYLSNEAFPHHPK